MAQFDGIRFAIEGKNMRSGDLPATDAGEVQFIRLRATIQFIPNHPVFAAAVLQISFASSTAVPEGLSAFWAWCFSTPEGRNPQTG